MQCGLYFYWKSSGAVDFHFAWDGPVGSKLREQKIEIAQSFNLDSMLKQRRRLCFSGAVAGRAPCRRQNFRIGSERAGRK
jgi:hypothetical protein